MIDSTKEQREIKTQMLKEVQRWIDNNNVFIVDFGHYDSNGRWVPLRTKQINILEALNE